MRIYSHRSLQQLETCHPDLQRLFMAVLPLMDHTILEGHRNQADQEKAFDAGNSKVHWPNGKHNTTPSDAVDAMPYPVSWTDTKRIYYFAGLVMATAAAMNIKLRWGGNFDGNDSLSDDSFVDGPHYELIHA